VGRDRRASFLTVRVLPTRACSLAQSGRGGSVDDHLHIVFGPIGLFAAVAAPWLGGGVGARVPPPNRQIDAPAIGYVVVDDHELLMMRCPDGQVAVEQHFDALSIAPTEDAAREELAIDREKKRVIPQHYAE
jgi:hypothetical protein